MPSLRSSTIVATRGLIIAAVLPVYAQETGGELYQSACAACHGSDGSGNLPSQLGFDLAIPDFKGQIKGPCHFFPLRSTAKPSRLHSQPN